MATHATKLQSTPRLQCLPEELLSNIVLRLDCDDACALRLTCKAIAAKTLHDFGHEFFTEKAFLLTPESLKVLTGIAESARLRRCLRKVNLLTACFTEREDRCDHGCSCTWHPTARQMEAFRTYVAGQKQLAESGDAVRILTRAFRSLPALHTIRLVDNPNLLCAGVDTAGLRKLTRKTARPPGFDWPQDRPDRQYTTWFSHVWRTLVQSIVKSGITTLTCFSTRIANPNNGPSINPDMKFSSKTGDGLAKAFAHVTSLGLVVPSMSTAHKGNNIQHEATGKTLRKFAALFPALEELSLRFDFADNSGVAYSQFVQHLPLCKFKTLRLEGIFIDAITLGLTLARCGSLEELRLTSIDISDASWVSILEILQTLPKLWHLDLMYLTDRGCKAYFLKQRESLRDDGVFAADIDGWDDMDEAYTDDNNDDMSDLEPWAPEGEASPDEPSDKAADVHMTVDFDPVASTTTTTCAPNAAISAAAGPLRAEHDDEEKENDFTAPGHHGGPERGYYVCIRTRVGIAKYLPIFKAEYNVGSGLDDFVFNGPPGLANMMVAGIFGGANGVPMPMASSAQGVNGSQTNQAGGAGGTVGPGHAAGGPISYQNFLNANQGVVVPPPANPPVVIAGVTNAANNVPIGSTGGGASASDKNNNNSNNNNNSAPPAHSLTAANTSSAHPQLPYPIGAAVLTPAQLVAHMLGGANSYPTATTSSSHAGPPPPPPPPPPPAVPSSATSHFGLSPAVPGAGRGEGGIAYQDAWMLEIEEEGETDFMAFGDDN